MSYFVFMCYAISAFTFYSISGFLKIEKSRKTMKLDVVSDPANKKVTISSIILSYVYKPESCEYLRIASTRFFDVLTLPYFG